MELPPPSGWYPDPYGVPGLLRWWDGSAWTQHTHTAGGTDAPDVAEPATAVQPTAVQSAVRPTAVQSTAVQPTAVQPAGAQPATVQPAAVQPAGAAPQEPDTYGTQVLFLGDDAWTMPGAPGAPGMPGAPGGPGGYGPGSDPYGYHQARQRRMWQAGGLVGGTAVALGLVAFVVYSIGNSHPAPPVTKTPAAAASTPLSPSPTAATPTLTPALTSITDGTSGLSYAELASPWSPTCPSDLNTEGFAWTTGESAIAAQINGGQTAWYSEACSAPLPQQAGYNGVADLENVTTNLVNQFTGTFYNALPHGFQQQVSQPVTVSGHAGWEIKYLITYQNTQGLPFANEEGAVVVADLGSQLPPAMFFTSIPGNLGEGNVDTLVSSLRLSAPPQPGGGGSPGDGSPGPGSPGPGGGDGHGGGDGGGGGNGP
jgi:hypothetical protein